MSDDKNMVQIVLERRSVTELYRLQEDRKKLYDRLMRVGYIPDKDMREAINKIRDDLNIRIQTLQAELMAGDRP